MLLQEVSPTGQANAASCEDPGALAKQMWCEAWSDFELRLEGKLRQKDSCIVWANGDD